MVSERKPLRFINLYFDDKFNYINKDDQMPSQGGMLLTEVDKNRVMHVGLPISKETILMNFDNMKANEKYTSFRNDFLL